MKYLLVFVLAFSGCATTAQFEKNIASWEGASEEQLISVWGPPQTAYPLPNGGKVLGFTRTGPTHANTTHNQYAGLNTTAQTKFCTTNFTLDGANRVVAWQYQGNSCKAD